MDPDTFDQIELSAELLGESKNYLAPGGKVDVLFVDESPLSVELPSTVASEGGRERRRHQRRHRQQRPEAREA